MAGAIKYVKKVDKDYLPNNTNRAKPKEKVSYMEILREVEARTGFRYADIKIVFLSLIEVLIETMASKKMVTIPKLGILFPSIKRGRYYTNFKGGVENPGKIYHPSRWVLRFQPAAFVTRKLLELDVSEKEEEEMYAHKTKKKQKNE